MMDLKQFVHFMVNIILITAIIKVNQYLFGTTFEDVFAVLIAYIFATRSKA